MASPALSPEDGEEAPGQKGQHGGDQDAAAAGEGSDEQAGEGIIPTRIAKEGGEEGGGEQGQAPAHQEGQSAAQGLAGAAARQVGDIEAGLRRIGRDGRRRRIHVSPSL
jgi:hypothetical protein